MQNPGLGRRYCRPPRRWAVGTCSLSEGNEVHIVEHREEEGVVEAVTVFPHKAEVWDLAQSASAPAGTLLTVYNSVQGGRKQQLATLWFMKERSFVMTLEERGSFHGVTSAAKHALWSPDAKTLVLLEERGLSVWDISAAAQAASASFAKSSALWSKDLHQEGSAREGSLLPTMEGGCWDPTPGALRVLCCWGQSVESWDLRSGVVAARIPQAHGVAARCVDVSASRPHLVATGGDDCKVGSMGYGWKTERLGDWSPSSLSAGARLGPAAVCRAAAVVQRASHALGVECPLPSRARQPAAHDKQRHISITHFVPEFAQSGRLGRFGRRGRCPAGLFAYRVGVRGRLEPGGGLLGICDPGVRWKACGQPGPERSEVRCTTVKWSRW